MKTQQQLEKLKVRLNKRTLQEQPDRAKERLQSANFCTKGEIPLIRKNTQYQAFEYIVGSLATEQQKSKVKSYFVIKSEDRSKPWHAQQDDYEIEDINQAMMSLLSETSDIELMRAENYKVQTRHKGETKGELALELVAKYKKIYPNNQREIEVITDCEECTTILNNCPCIKRDKHQI